MRHVQIYLKERSKLEEYCGVQTAGKLCYFTSGKSFLLPIRDICNEYHSGFKKEPNYETATYNLFRSCNQRTLVATVHHGISHIFFLTKYHGEAKEYLGKYFISGVYKIGWVGEIADRIFIKASSMAFTSIYDAYEITPERWRKICPISKYPELRNLRYASQTIKGSLFDEIIAQLELHNTVEEYVNQAKIVTVE